MIAMDSYMLHGPQLCLAQERRRLVDHMAADLAWTGAFLDRGDSVKQLHRDGYRTVDIMILVDEAIYACKQEAIAREMSDVNHLASADLSTAERSS